jgi:glutathione S-transferase
METAFANMYSDQLTDLFNKLPEPSQNNTLISSLFKTYLKPFEARLITNGGFLAGTRLTYADLYLSSMLENLREQKNETLQEFPFINDLDQRVRSMFRIKDYLQNRAALIY